MTFIIIIIFKYLFIYLWLCWVFVSVRGLSLVAASGGHSSSRCAGLSPSQPLLLRSTGSRRAGSVVVEHRLQTLRLSNCGSRAQLLHGMWDLPRLGLEPVSPALAGRFSTTAPPRKPRLLLLKQSGGGDCFYLFESQPGGRTTSGSCERRQRGVRDPPPQERRKDSGAPGRGL